MNHIMQAFTSLLQRACLLLSSHFLPLLTSPLLPTHLIRDLLLKVGFMDLQTVSPRILSYP